MQHKTRTFFTAATLLLTTVCTAQTELKQKAILLKRVIEINHFAPRQMNDSFSVLFFNAVLKTLDPQKKIFIQSEYDRLASFSTQLDDELNGKNWQFFTTLKTVYKSATTRADSLTKVILQKPLNFTTKEDIKLLKKPQDFYPASVEELLQRYNRLYKYLALANAYTIALNNEDGLSFEKVLEKNEALLREKIKKTALLENRFAGNAMDVLLEETYLNCLSSTYDPHTNYFSQSDNQAFQESLSTEALTFGFDINETEDGKIIIARLAPGGPAWISGEINQQDQVLQIQPEGKTVTDVSLVSLDDVYELITDPEIKQAVIKLKKQDGTTKSVTLKKAKHEQEEDIIQAFVLKNENGGDKKFGYMMLPDFYTTWDDELGSGCANDMAKKIVQMKREQINGLILDFRYNGGGSLTEALEIAGIFINDGPLMGIKDKSPKVTFLKDPNRGVIYDGPLVVLVNGQSASASELVAATLQDYNRAIVVGSNTFGKATMQAVLPMDTVKKNAETRTFVKTTLGKLYRLDGSTAQHKGVIPDVVLPDFSEERVHGEASFPTSLKPDQVQPNAYYKPLAKLPVVALAAASKKRVEASAFYKQILDYNKLNAQETITIPLQAASFEKWAKQNSEMVSSKEQAEYKSKAFSAHNLNADQAKITRDSYFKIINDATLENILEDGYIEEAVLILSDFLNIK